MYIFIQYTHAQILTYNATPAFLVNTTLLGGGVTASAITYTGYTNSIARFTATAGTNLGFADGLFLTSGSAIVGDPLFFGNLGPQGPNTNFQSDDIGMATGINYSDTDLETMLQSLTCDPTTTSNDATVLEFNFVPMNSTITFRYRFGSEEYNTFVSPLCSGFGFNDIFAFYITGITTPLPETNIALLPSSTTPVSIFTVNNGISEPSTGPCVNCAYFVDNSVVNNVNVTYDGITTILTATRTVIPGQTYHFKIAISDGGDNSFDSGVFIQGDSFVSLPVELANFKPICEGDNLKFVWSTMTETNSSHFIIEASDDLQSWEEINRVNAAGYSNQELNYELITEKINQKYVRLKQLDNDGTEHIYEADMIDCELESELTIYPNPSDDIIYLDAKQTIKSIDIYSCTGKLVQSINTNGSSKTEMVDCSELNSGVYYIYVSTSQKKLVRKIIVN